VSRKTLHYWDVSGFLGPSVAKAHGTGTRRVYSFQDLVAVRVARELRNAGLSLQALRRLVRYLRTRGGLKHPMAEAFLVTDGREVFERKGDVLVSALRRPGQGLLFHVVDLTRTVDEMHRAVLKLGRPRRQPPGRKGRSRAS
jgi:DNA-binding transcriptional MerR regulator